MHEGTKEIEDSLSHMDLPERTAGLILRFLSRWKEVVLKNRADPIQVERILSTFLREIQREIVEPTLFHPYHQRITTPFNYTEFGQEFMLLSLDLERSKVYGSERLQEIKRVLSRGENVIFFSNHQIEPDPQVIQILLGLESKSQNGEKWIDEMIFVAGDRVTRDPMAVPLSLGCNLLCIHSKKYIDTPKELKEQKLLHNKKTLKKMEKLLSEGGKMIYVAPSGGRDRKNADGVIRPAPFDPNSIELFYLIALKTKKKNHFYPLALYTYNLLPPPLNVQIELGEEREPAYAPCFIALGEKIPEERLKLNHDLPKEERRAARCQIVYEAVCKEYNRFTTNC